MSDFYLHQSDFLRNFDAHMIWTRSTIPCVDENKT